MHMNIEFHDIPKLCEQCHSISTNEMTMLDGGEREREALLGITH